MDILLIDDDVDELAIFKEALNQTGISHKVYWAEDAFSAAALLYKGLPAIVFVDFNLPKMDGLRCIEFLRKIDGVKNIPTVLYSTTIKDDYREAAKKLDVVCFSKGSDFKSLVSQLKEYFAPYFN